MLKTISPVPEFSSLPKPSELSLEYTTRSSSSSSASSPKPAQNPPKHHHRRNNNPREFQHRHFVTLARHDAQPAGAAFNARGHVGEGLGGVVDDVLVACIVVDVDGDAT